MAIDGNGWMTAKPRRERRSGRAASAVMVAAVHGLIGYALVMGLDPDRPRSAAGELTLLTVREVPPPPPPDPIPPPRAMADRQEKAAPPSRPSRAPTPIVAPRAIVIPVAPVPIVTAPVAGIGFGNAPGTSARPGSGEGNGEGNGEGDGGGGGIAARQIRGAFRRSDFPRSLRDAARVTVSVEFSVEKDGRVGRCAITETSGYAELDAIACRVIQSRYRFEPATDDRGDPVVEIIGETETWWLDR